MFPLIIYILGYLIAFYTSCKMADSLLNTGGRFCIVINIFLLLIYGDTGRNLFA